MEHHVVTDEELAQARNDPAFRRQLIAHNLDYLLMVLARMRASEDASNPASVLQIRQGAQLAVQLASLLHRADGRIDAA